MSEFAKNKWQKVPEKNTFSAPSQWNTIRFEYQGIIFNKKSPKIFTNAYGHVGGDPRLVRFPNSFGSSSKWVGEPDYPRPYGQPDCKFSVSVSADFPKHAYMEKTSSVAGMAIWAKKIGG